MTPAVDYHIGRWVTASCAVYFKTVADAISLKFILEGEDRRRSDSDNIDVNKENIELRIDGPHTIVKPGFVYYDFEINTLISVTKNDEEIYRHLVIIGLFGNAFAPYINIYKKGGLAGIDDDSFVGCLERRPILDSDREIVISNFGEIEATTDIVQSTIEGHYRLTKG